MKKSFSILAALFLALVWTSGCDDYDEGPSFSFRSKEERVVNNWIVEFVFQDDKDVTARYDSMMIAFDYDESVVITTYDDNDSAWVQKGLWAFTEDHEGIRIDYTDPVVWPDRAFYSILRLKEEQLWLTQDMDSTFFQWRFLPIAEN